MVITAPTRILLLLTAGLGVASDLPLDIAEFDRMTAWLKRTRLKPVDLFDPELLERLSWAPSAPFPLDRLVTLLQRGPLLDEALARWHRSGLWVIGRDDPAYPRRMKRRMRSGAPALLFGSGDRLLLNRGGITLVGGDSGDPELVGYAARFAARAAAAGLATISGIRNVVEEAALLGSLSRGGIAVAVLPDGLQKEVADDRLRRAPGNGRLVMVSAAEPDTISAAGDDAGAAAASRCLYGFADAALLIGVGRDSDRWAEAVRAIEGEWSPQWVRSRDPEAMSLIRLGAQAVPDDEVAPRMLLQPRPSTPAGRGSAGIRQFTKPVLQPVASGFVSGFAEPPDMFSPPPPDPAIPRISNARGSHLRLVDTAPRPPASPTSPVPTVAERSLYGLFEQQLALLLNHGPLGVKRIAEELELTRQQVDAWLLRAEIEALVRLDPVTRLYYRA